MATIAQRGLLEVIVPTRSNVPDDLQSREDRTLVQKNRDLVQRSAGYRARGLLSGDALKITEYHPVPPKRSFTISVRYEYRGRGTPLPYPLDSEE
jgi:hypothetical protein